MNTISFNGSESTGSIGKRVENPVTKQETKLLDEPIQDTVSFRGRDNDDYLDYDESDDKKTISTTTKVLIGIGLTALTIAGLGYAHKIDLVGKLNDGKFKDFMRKSDCVTEKCHDWCSQIKKLFTKK